VRIILFSDLFFPFFFLGQPPLLCPHIRPLFRSITHTDNFPVALALLFLSFFSPNLLIRKMSRTASPALGYVQSFRVSSLFIPRPPVLFQNASAQSSFSSLLLVESRPPPFFTSAPYPQRRASFYPFPRDHVAAPHLDDFHTFTWRAFSVNLNFQCPNARFFILRFPPFTFFF